MYAHSGRKGVLLETSRLAEQPSNKILILVYCPRYANMLDIITLPICPLAQGLFLP